jgi:hypothetical protein
MTLETMLGLRDDPAYLDRYGPIAARIARDLARDGTWRCAVLDDTHGTVLGLGHATYRSGYAPGARLRDLTAHTYRQCSFPTCRARAQICDYEHAVRWPDGVTCSCNGHPVCRRHHRLKTAGLIRIQMSTDPAHPPGSVIWTTRTGRRYLSTPPRLGPTDGGHEPSTVNSERQTECAVRLVDEWRRRQLPPLSPEPDPRPDNGEPPDEPPPF